MIWPSYKITHCFEAVIKNQYERLVITPLTDSWSIALCLKIQPTESFIPEAVILQLNLETVYTYKHQHLALQGFAPIHSV